MNGDEKNAWVEAGDGVFGTRGATCTNCGERKQRCQGARQASVADLKRGGQWGGGNGIGRVSVAIKKVIQQTGCCKTGRSV